MGISVVRVCGGVAEVVFQSPDVETHIFDMDGDVCNYLYKDKYVCQIVTVNDDGTLDLKCVDTTDGSRHNRSFLGVPVDDVEFFSSLEDSDYADDLDEQEGA